MNSALSHNLSIAISRVAPAFKINGDEASRRLLAILFPDPTVVLPTAPTVAPVPLLNLVGLNPTLQKKLVQFFDEFNGKGNEDVYADTAESFLAHINQMSAKDYAARAPQDHLREFLKPKKSNAAAAPITLPKPEPEVEVDENAVAVMWKGTEYWVGETSRRVYRETAEGVNEFVGMLGLAEFHGMEMPVDEE